MKTMWSTRLGGGIVQPAGAAGFEQVECSDDIRMNEIAGAGDGAIHVGFGGEMHHLRDGMFLDDLQNGRLVAQINFFKNEFRMLGDFFQIGEMPGIGEAIEIDEALDFGAVNNVVNEIGADEARAAG